MENSINISDTNGEFTTALRIIYFVLSISGLAFTLILLLTLSKKLKKTSHSDMILTIIIVSVDFTASVGLLFRAIFSQYPYNILKAHYNWCVYDNFINSLVLVFSGYTLSILSLQRVMLIVFNFRVSIYIWILIILILCFPAWGLALYQALNNNVLVSIVEVFCIVKNNQIGKIYYLYLMVCTLATYLLTIVSYISIIVFSCRQCLKQLTLNLDKSVVYKECRVIIFKSLFFLIPYMLIYSGRMFCWFYDFSTGKQRTWTMEYVSVIMLSTGVVVNCLTVLYMNKEINKEFLNTVSKFKNIFSR
jgi:hypothetical protein